MRGNGPLTVRHIFLALALTVFATVPTSAIESDFGGPDNRNAEPGYVGPLSSITLRDKSNRSFTIKGLVAIASGRVYGGHIDGGIKPRDEDKIGIVRDIPLAGQFFTERLRAKDFDPGLRIGTVYRHEGVLIIDLRAGSTTAAGEPLPGDMPLMPRLRSLGESGQPTLRKLLVSSGAEVTGLRVVNQTQSFDVPLGTLRSLPDNGKLSELSRLPASPWFFTTPVGEAYLRGPELLLLVRPSILTGWD